MMMPIFSSMYATNLSFAGAGGVQGANQERLGLANAVTGGESMGDVASLAAQDKALALQGISSQTNYQVGQLMQESAQTRKQKYFEHQRKMIENGAIF